MDIDTPAQRGRSKGRFFRVPDVRADAEVGLIHNKAMPVILTTTVEIEGWLAAPWEEAVTLQRPLHDGALKIVAVGRKTDEPA